MNIETVAKLSLDEIKLIALAAKKADSDNPLSQVITLTKQDVTSCYRR